MCKSIFRCQCIQYSLLNLMHCYTGFYQCKIIYGIYKITDYTPIFLQYMASCIAKGGESGGESALLQARLWPFTRWAVTALSHTLQFFCRCCPLSCVPGRSGTAVCPWILLFSRQIRDCCKCAGEFVLLQVLYKDCQ